MFFNSLKKISNSKEAAKYWKKHYEKRYSNIKKHGYSISVYKNRLDDPMPIEFCLYHENVGEDGYCKYWGIEKKGLNFQVAMECLGELILIAENRIEIDDFFNFATDLFV